MILFAVSIMLSLPVQALRYPSNPFYAAIGLLLFPVDAFPAVPQSRFTCWNPLTCFRRMRPLPTVFGTSKASGPVRRNFVRLSVAMKESIPCMCLPKDTDSIQEEIQNIWEAYIPGKEKEFPPAMFENQQSILKSFENSNGAKEAIRLQCETLLGVDVVPECLSYSMGPTHFYIISAYIIVQDIKNLKLRSSREIFYDSLGIAILDMHNRQVSFQNIQSIKQYDPSNYFAVITDFSKHISYNAKHFDADWASFWKVVPEDLKEGMTPHEYL